MPIFPGAVAHAGPAPIASNAPKNAAKPLRGVKTVYEARSEGNIFFNRQMRREIAGAGFVWTNDKTKADALVSTRGDWRKDGGFLGEVQFRTQTGRILWEKQIVREPNSRKMAFQSLGEELRKAR